MSCADPSRRTVPGMSRTPVTPACSPAPTYRRSRRCEAGLVARLAAGDRDEPLDALYDRYGRRLYGLGLHLLDDRGLAEDLVQETFVRLWRSADGTTPGARRCERSSTRWHDGPPSTCCGGARRAVGRGRGARDEHRLGGAAFDELVHRVDVREALDALTPTHREMLELQY